MSPNNKATDLFNVKGLVAVITGGGSGLGLYAARALDANGAKAVYIVGRREETLKEAVKTAVNGTIKPIVGDVTDKDSLTKVADQVRQALQNIVAVLKESGGKPEHIVRMTWYVTDKHEYLAAGRAVGAAFREIIGSYNAAMTAVQVTALIEDRAKVEIEATAVVPA